MACHALPHEFSECRHSYLPLRPRSTPCPGHTCLQKQLKEQTQNFFVSSSKNVEKKKEKKIKRKTTAKLFPFHAHAIYLGVNLKKTVVRIVFSQIFWNHCFQMISMPQCFRSLSVTILHSVL